jgi:transcriptional regulator with XRE-family HTH domain
VGARPVLGSIAANVRRIRDRRGVTQEQLAELAGLELRHLQKIEAAEVNFGVTLLVAIADALDVRPGTLLRPARLATPTRGRPARRG